MTCHRCAALSDALIHRDDELARTKAALHAVQRELARLRAYGLRDPILDHLTGPPVPHMADPDT